MKTQLEKQCRKLELYEWYDHSNDLLICQECFKAYQDLGTHIRRIHGLDNEEYKKKFKIPMGQSLQSKRLLTKKSIHMNRLRDEGKCNVYEKGETGLPIEYQKMSVKPNHDTKNPINRKIVSMSLKGIKKSQEHIEKMRINSKNQYEEGTRSGLIPFEKGRISEMKGKTFEESFGIRKANRMKKILSEKAYIRSSKKKELLSKPI